MSSKKPKKPFGEDDDEEVISKPKIGLKNLGTQPSQSSRHNTQEEFDSKVQGAIDRNSSYKERASDLALQFKKMMIDKTLQQNKNIFSQEMEREVLSKMIQLAVEINNDPHEQEGMGSLTWITLLFTSCLSQRDRINKLEYSLLQLEKKIDFAGLDKKNTSE
jgi:hypothetical protein